MKEKNNKAVILLSGGLDSVVSLAIAKNTCKEILALTFDYGQKSFEAEKKSAIAVSEFYNIKHEVIKLDWLRNISTSSLNTNQDIPTVTSVDDLNNKEYMKKTAKSVWVPNRNGLFVNIAACFADSLKYNLIILGANKEEAATFKDNSADFITSINKTLSESCENEIQLFAPLIDKTKSEIVETAIELNVPLNLIHSCYSSNENHCGKCESCLRLKRALEQNNRTDIIKDIFK